MNKKILTITLFAGCYMWTQAQTTTADNDTTVFERNITVERDYIPTIQEANRLPLSPKTQTQQMPQRSVTYTDFNRPITTEPTVASLDKADMAFNYPEKERGFARLGIGLYWNTLADLTYQVVEQQDMRMDVYAHHSGVFGHKKLSETNFGLNFTKLFDRSELYTNIKATNTFLNYYGKCYVDSTDTYDYKALNNMTDKTASYWTAEARVGWRSIATEELQYAAEIGYNHFNLGTHTGTHSILAQGGMSGYVADQQQVGATITLNSTFYYLPNTVLNPTTHLHIEPFYRLEFDLIRLHAGVNIDFLFGDQFMFAPSPNIQFEWLADPDMMSLYLNATGSYEFSTPQSAIEGNRYVGRMAAMLDSINMYKPIDVAFGLKVKPMSGLLVNPFVSYSYRINQDFYHYDNSNGTFRIFGANASVIDAGLSVGYHYNDRVKINAGGAYHHWLLNEAHAWDRPAWDAWIDVMVRINSKWAIQADATITGKRYALADNETKELGTGYNINLSGIYTPNRWLSLFVKLNNIAHNRYEQFYAYETYGFQGLIGASVSF